MRDLVKTILGKVYFLLILRPVYLFFAEVFKVIELRIVVKDSNHTLIKD